MDTWLDGVCPDDTIAECTLYMTRCLLFLTLCLARSGHRLPYNQALMTPRDEGESGDTQLLAQQLADLGGKVQSIRETHGLSQQDLADQTGIARPSITLIEAGRQNATLATVSRLASGLGVHWADLLDDRKTSPPRPHRRPVPFDEQLAAFGRRLYQARVIQRLHQRTLTDRTRIGRSAISEMEDGKRNISLSTLSRLAATLGVHWADLLDDRKTNPPQPVRSRKDRPT